MSEVIKDYISIDEENRQFAVKARDCNILLEAAAGSGKTTTLVNRIVERLLYDKNTVDIDNLLVVTFTRDAAAELRLRLDKELNNAFLKALEEGKNELAEKAYRQKLMLPKASIGTIDSFCLDVVQKNYLTAGIDPVFRIDTDEAKIIIDEAMDVVLERWYSRKDSEDYQYLKEFVDLFCGVSSDQEFKENLLKNIYYFASNFGDPVEWLKKISEQYSADIDMKDEDNIWYCYIRDTLYQACDEICQYIDQVVACIRGESEIKVYAAFSDPSQVDKFFLGDKEIFENLKEVLTKSEEGIFSDALFIKLKGYTATKLVKEEALDTFYALKVFREEYKNYFNTLRKELISGSKDEKEYIALSIAERKEHFYDGIRAIGRYVDVLCRIVSEIVCEVNETMTRRHIFNFNRVSALAYNIIKDDNIAAQYRERFAEIYIDEYQDTSILQESILQRISRAEDGVQNVFMVGDVKQSIYGFRNATPEYFVKKYNTYKDNPDEGKLRILTRNFRSRKNILDAVNSVFYAVMKKGISDIEYTQDEALNYGAVNLYENNPLNDENDGKAELWICKNSGKSSEEQEEEEISPLQNVYRDEFLLVVDKIMDLFEKDFKVYDRDSKTMRPIRFSDIAILTHNNSEVSHISGILRDFGIPAAAMSEELLIEKQEVISVLDFMKVVDNPYRDYPLVSLMTSEFFAFNENEIAIIRALSGKKSDNYYTSLLNVNREGFVSKEGEVLPENLKRKVQSFMETIDLYRHLSKVETLSRLTWLIMNHNGFYEKNSTEGKGNLRLLLDKTYPYDSGSEAGLYNFITYIESLDELGLAEFKAYVEDSGDNDKVRLLTLHKSKGLEFPVVFIINAGKTFYNKRQEGKVFIDSKLGIGFTFMSDKKDEKLRIEEMSAPMLALRHHKRRGVFCEEQRLLYVAMTRAREKLFVIARCNKDDYERLSSDYPNIASNVSIRAAENYISFILYALESAAGKNAWSVFKAGGSHKNLCEGKASERINAIKLNMTAGKELSSEAKNESNERMLDEFYRDDEQLKMIQNMFSEVDGGRLPAKISVSAVKKVLADEDSKGSTSDFNSTKVKTLKETTERDETTVEAPLSATQLGTLMHKCFEHLIKARSGWPIGASTGELEKYAVSFVDGLLSKGILSETERNAVQIPFLTGFLGSDRAKEISTAAFACEEVPFTFLLDFDEMFSEEEKSRLDKNFGESGEKTVAIQGVIDLYYKTPDGKFVLADFKTDKIYAGNEELLKDKYSVQLRCYAKALENISGEKISESVLLFVREGKEFIYDHHKKAWRN